MLKNLKPAEQGSQDEMREIVKKSREDLSINDFIREFRSSEKDEGENRLERTEM